MRTRARDEKTEVPTSAHDGRPNPAVTFLNVRRVPPPAALFNLTRKHWLSTTSFHSTTLVPHPANLPEPSWSKLTLSKRTHEHDEYLSPRPRSGSPRLGCTRQSTHGGHRVSPAHANAHARTHAHAHAHVSIDLHLPHHISHSRRCPLPEGCCIACCTGYCIQLPSRFAIVQADRKRDREIHT